MAEFRSKTSKEHLDECPIRIEKIYCSSGQRKHKFLLVDKTNGKNITDKYFDDITNWSSFDLHKKEDLFGWCCSIFKDTPVKCSRMSLYPYHVNATIYKYTSDGFLLNTTEGDMYMWESNTVDGIIDESLPEATKKQNNKNEKTPRNKRRGYQTSKYSK